MAHQLFSLPRGTAISSNLTLVAGARVRFFLTTTTTPTPVYQDSALTIPHTQPVEADAAGRLPPIYLDPTIVYKITFTDGADVEIYPAVDPVNDQFLSQAIIGGFLYPRTPAEIAAGVTPVNYAYPPNHAFRYMTTVQIASVIARDLTQNVTAPLQVLLSVSRGGEAYLPAGDYLVTTTLELNYDQVTTGFVREGVSISGEGPEKSRIVTRVAGPTFKHTQSVAQAAAFSFAHGCNFRDFSVVGDGSTPANCHGFQLAGTFSPVFSRVFVRLITGHGWYCPYDGALGTPDAYGNAYLTIDDCTASENDGWAVLIADGATTFHITNPLFISNLTGGVYGAGIQAARIIGGAVSYNGTAGLGGSCGIHIAFNADAAQTPHNWLIEDCEIDRNLNFQVRVHGYNNEIRRCRFIDQSTTGVPFKSAVQAEVGLATVFTSNNKIERNVLRLERVSGADTTSGFTFAADSLNNDVIRNHFSFATGVTECVMAGTGNRYFDVAGLLQKQSSNDTKYPTAIAYISGAGVTALADSTLTTVPLNAEIFDSHGWFNTTTNAYVVQFTGLLNVKGKITLDNYVTGKFANLFVVVAGNTLDATTHALTINAADIAGLSFDTDVPVVAGDSVIVSIITDAGTSANFKQGATHSRVTFRMLP